MSGGHFKGCCSKFLGALLYNVAQIKGAIQFKCYILIFENQRKVQPWLMKIDLCQQFLSVTLLLMYSDLIRIHGSCLFVNIAITHPVQKYLVLKKQDTPKTRKSTTNMTKRPIPSRGVSSSCCLTLLLCSTQLSRVTVLQLFGCCIYGSSIWESCCSPSTY